MWCCFNRRLSLTLDYYTKITDPLIIQIGVAPSTGKNDFITNLGRNTIKGLTLDLGVKVIDNREKGSDLELFVEWIS